MIIFVPVLPPNKDFEDHFVHMLLALNVGVHCKQVLQIVFSPLELPDFRLQMAVNKYISKYVHCVWGMVIAHGCIPSPTEHTFSVENSLVHWTEHKPQGSWPTRGGLHQCQTSIATRCKGDKSSLRNCKNEHWTSEIAAATKQQFGIVNFNWKLKEAHLLFSLPNAPKRSFTFNHMGKQTWASKFSNWAIASTCKTLHMKVLVISLFTLASNKFV